MLNIVKKYSDSLIQSIKKQSPLNKTVKQFTKNKLSHISVNSVSSKNLSS